MHDISGILDVGVYVANIYLLLVEVSDEGVNDKTSLETTTCVAKFMKRFQFSFKLTKIVWKYKHST